MDFSDFSLDLAAGEIRQEEIRYLMMRPDVLMGIGRQLGAMQTFVEAMEESAFLNARDSFARYKARGLFDGADALQHSCEIAAALGWGRWRVTERAPNDTLVEVHNSPFAAGAGPQQHPVCGVISGILRAIYITAHGRTVRVEETACAAQGHDHCTFQLSF